MFVVSGFAELMRWWGAEREGAGGGGCLGALGWGGRCACAGIYRERNKERRPGSERVVYTSGRLGPRNTLHRFKSVHRSRDSLVPLD